MLQHLKQLKAIKKFNRGLGVEEKDWWTKCENRCKSFRKRLGVALGTPAALLAPLEAMNISRSIAEGDSAVDIATDPLNYLGAAFVGPAS